MEELSESENLEMEEEIEDVESGGNDSDDPQHYNADDSEKTWIQWFCDLEGNEFLCEIGLDWLSSKYNLTGLTTLFPDFRFKINQRNA